MVVWGVALGRGGTMIAVIGNDLNDGLWLFGVLRWGSPSGPAPPLALTPALSRPAGEGEAPAALCLDIGERG